jgi:hypothetical protein
MFHCPLRGKTGRNNVLSEVMCDGKKSEGNCSALSQLLKKKKEKFMHGSAKS